MKPGKPAVLFVHGGRSRASCPPRHVCFLHGAGGGAWEWSIWRRVFAAEGFSSAAPDLVPAAGGLSVTRFDDYSAQMQAAIEALPAPRILVGASLGGLLALANAGLADALVLVNPMPPDPWHALLPSTTPCPGIIRWGGEASLAGTRRAMPDADEATCLHAFRRWRDESGAVMNEARAGIAMDLPRCRCLMLASGLDEDVPATVSEALAAGIGANLVRLPQASHVGPLLGRNAAAAALQAVAWLNALPEAG